MSPLLPPRPLQVHSRQHKVPNALAAAHGVFKGLGHGFQTVQKATVSGFRSLATTAKRFTGLSRSRDNGEIELPKMEMESTNESYVSRISELDANSDDEVAVAIVQLRTAAVGAGKVHHVVTASEAHALKADGLAKYKEQQSQLQATLAAADAAASRAVCGGNLGIAGAGHVLGMGQLGFFGELVDCELSDMAVCTDKAQTDIECAVSDCDGVDEDEWAALLADPDMAAVIANLQAGIKAC